MDTQCCIYMLRLRQWIRKLDTIFHENSGVIILLDCDYYASGRFDVEMQGPSFVVRIKHNM
jgi:hypothetical protein